MAEPRPQPTLSDSEARQARKLAASLRKPDLPDAVDVNSGNDGELRAKLSQIPGFRIGLIERIVLLRPFTSKLDLITRVNEGIVVSQSRLGPKFLPHLHAGALYEPELFKPQRRGPKTKAKAKAHPQPEAAAHAQDDSSMCSIDMLDLMMCEPTAAHGGSSNSTTSPLPTDDSAGEVGASSAQEGNDHDPLPVSATEHLLARVVDALAPHMRDLEPHDDLHSALRDALFAIEPVENPIASNLFSTAPLVASEPTPSEGLPAPSEPALTFPPSPPVTESSAVSARGHDARPCETSPDHWAEDGRAVDAVADAEEGRAKHAGGAAVGARSAYASSTSALRAHTSVAFLTVVQMALVPLSLVAFLAHLISLPSLTDATLRARGRAVRATLSLVGMPEREAAATKALQSERPWFFEDAPVDSRAIHRELCELTFRTIHRPFIYLLAVAAIHLTMLSLGMLVIDISGWYPRATGVRPINAHTLAHHLEQHSIALIVFAELVFVRSRFCTARTLHMSLVVATFTAITIHAYPAYALPLGGDCSSCISDTIKYENGTSGQSLSYPFAAGPGQYQRLFGIVINARPHPSNDLSLGMAAQMEEWVRVVLHDQLDLYTMEHFYIAVITFFSPLKPIPTILMLVYTSRLLWWARAGSIQWGFPGEGNQGVSGACCKLSQPLPPSSLANVTLIVCFLLYREFAALQYVTIKMKQERTALARIEQLNREKERLDYERRFSQHIVERLRVMIDMHPKAGGGVSLDATQIRSEGGIPPASAMHA
jgi:hypothetical protein